MVTREVILINKYELGDISENLASIGEKANDEILSVQNQITETKHKLIDIHNFFVRDIYSVFPGCKM